MRAFRTLFHEFVLFVVEHEVFVERYVLLTIWSSPFEAFELSLNFAELLLTVNKFWFQHLTMHACHWFKGSLKNISPLGIWYQYRESLNPWPKLAGVCVVLSNQLEALRDNMFIVAVITWLSTWIFWSWMNHETVKRPLENASWQKWNFNYSIQCYTVQELMFLGFVKGHLPFSRCWQSIQYLKPWAAQKWIKTTRRIPHAVNAKSSEITVWSMPHIDGHLRIIQEPGEHLRHTYHKHTHENRFFFYVDH